MRPNPGPAEPPLVSRRGRKPGPAGRSSLPSSPWELEPGIYCFVLKWEAPNPAGAAPPARLSPCLSFPTANELV